MKTDTRIEANGFTQGPLGAAASEVDRLRGQVARLQDALCAIERTVGFVPGNEPLAVWVERAVKEREEFRSKLWHWTNARYNFTEADDNLDVWQRLDCVYERLVRERDELRSLAEDLSRAIGAPITTSQLSALQERCQQAISRAKEAGI